MTVLQEFLRDSLLDLDGDDTRLQKLQAAATALAKQFAAKPISMSIPTLFAALRQEDSNVGAAFDDTAKAIEDQWTTYKSAFKGGNATTLYRAVALQALFDAIESEPKLGIAVALLMRNLRSEIAAGKYDSAIRKLIDKAEGAFSSECRAAMTPVAAVKHGLAAPAKASKIDRPALQKRIDAAAGPHNRQGQPNDAPTNAHWPNAGNPWSYDFSDGLTAILGDYIDLAMSKAAELDAKNQAAIGSSIGAVAVIDSAIKRSTALLWWRQALYSESGQQPYRSLAPTDAIVHAVIDLADHIPPAYESALDSFLTEAILALDLGSTTVDIEALRQVSAACSSKLREAFLCEVPHGMAISAILGDEAAASTAASALLPQQWAVWLLREFMAIKAVGQIQVATSDLAA